MIKKRYATLRQIEPAPDSISSESSNSSSSSSSTSSSAIYYNALFDVPNEDGKLRIDMTAQVYIVLDSVKNALLVPSSALSSRPAGAQNRTARTQTTGASTPNAEHKQRDKDKNTPSFERMNLNADQKQAVAEGKASLSVVRILQADGSAQPKQVLIGINNRVNAQVLAGLKQGDQVIIADSADTSAASANSGNRRRGPMGM